VARRARLRDCSGATRENVTMTNSPAYRTFSKQVLAQWAKEAPVVQGFRDPGAKYPNNNGTPPGAEMTFGLLSGSGIQIKLVTQSTGHVPPQLPGWSKVYLSFDLTGNVIVGFSVSPTWRDGTDGYWCLVSGGIGKDKAHFAFQSQYDRGLDYSVTVAIIDGHEWRV